jgi:hypothetical protein
VALGIHHDVGEKPMMTATPFQNDIIQEREALLPGEPSPDQNQGEPDLTGPFQAATWQPVLSLLAL